MPDLPPEVPSEAPSEAPSALSADPSADPSVEPSVLPGLDALSADDVCCIHSLDLDLRRQLSTLGRSPNF
jgi:hypothetical protein